MLPPHQALGEGYNIVKNTQENKHSINIYFIYMTIIHKHMVIRIMYSGYKFYQWL